MPTMTIELTDAVIETLQTEAAIRGDDDAVWLCENALNGNNAARFKLEQMWRAAQASETGAR